MKRLLAQIGLTYLSVLAVVFYFGKTAALVIAILSLLLFVLFLSVSKFRKTIYLPVMAIVAIVACVVNLSYSTFVFEKLVEQYDGKSGTAVVTLKEEPSKLYDTYSYRFNCREFNGEECDFNFIAYSDFFYIDPFDTVELDVKLYATQSNANISKKCFFVGYLGGGTPDYKFISCDDKSFYARAIKIRQDMRKVLKETLHEDAFSLCSALLLGDKFAMKSDLRQDFTKAGVSHLVVVSGMHFSVLACIFFYFSRKMFSLRFLFIPLAVGFILLYMAITGYTPSVVRSAVMLLVYAFGMTISRQSYSPNSLGFAALVVTIGNPFCVGDVGLILSFVSTFAIICFAPKMSAKFYRRKKTRTKEPEKSKSDSKIVEFLLKHIRKIPTKIKRTFVDMFCIGVCAYLATLPISILFFNSFSTMAIITTFLLSIPINILLVISFLICIVYYCAPLMLTIVSLFGFCCIYLVKFVLPILGYIANVITDLVIIVVEFVASFEFSYIHNTYNFVYVFIIFALVLCLMYYVLRSENKGKIISVCIATVFLFGYLSAVMISTGVSQLYIYDVGNGCAVMYSSGNTGMMLTFDCSESNAYEIIDKLDNTVSDIDFYSCPNDNFKAHNNVAVLLEAFAIDDVLVYDTKSEVDTSDLSENVITPVDVTKVKVDDSTVASYVKTGRKYTVYLETVDGTVAIFDRGVDIEDVPQRYRTADTIVLSECCDNFELLSCETLIISAKEEFAYNIMKQMGCIAERVILTCEGDIKMIMGVW